MTTRRHSSISRLIAGAAAVTAALSCSLAARAETASAQPAFSTPFSLGSGLGPQALAVGPEGTAWLAQGNRGVVKLWIRRANGALSARQFNLSGGYPLATPAVRVAAGSGWAVVAWEGLDQLGTHARIQAVRCTPAACGPVRSVFAGAGGGQDAGLQAVAVGRRALLLSVGAAYRHGRPLGVQQVRWALSDAHGRYGRARTLGGASFGYAPTALAATAHGRAVAAWVGSGPEKIVLAEFDGRRFGRVSDAPGPAGVEPHLAAAGDEVLLAWRAGLGDAEGYTGSGPVYVARQGPGRASFGPGQEISACSCRDLSLAASPAGRAVLAFHDLGALSAPGDSGSDPEKLMASLREPAGAFGAAATLAPALHNSWGYTTAVDAAGVATVAWTNDAALLASQAAPSQPLGAPFQVDYALTPPFFPPGGAPFPLRIPLSAPQAEPLGSGTLLTWHLPPSTPSAAPGAYVGALGP